MGLNSNVCVFVFVCVLGGGGGGIGGVRASRTFNFPLS